MGTALLTGGVLLLKGLAVAGLAIAASRARRAAIAVEEQDAAFALLAANEPAQCYRRLICDLATGGLEKSENDVIVNLFNKDASIESAKFEFVTAAKIGKKHKSVQTCELRYSCPLTGEQGEDDPDHVRDLQHARHVRRHPGCALPVRLRTYHRYRHGLRRRCLPRRPRLRGLRSPPRHRPSGPGWP